MPRDIGPVNTPLSVRLDAPVIAALDQLAAQTDRSRNWLVARAVEDYLILNAWQIDKIKTGLAAADTGDFATTADIARLRAKYGAVE